MIEEVASMQWDSRAELELFLRELRNVSILIGADREAVRKHYSVEASSGDYNVSVGLLTADHGPPPSFRMDLRSSRLWIGSDMEIVCIDLAKSSIIFVVPLDGVFFSFCHDEKNPGMVAIHELGAVHVGESGAILWHVATGIVTSSKCAEGHVMLATGSAHPSVDIELASGRISR